MRIYTYEEDKMLSQQYASMQDVTLLLYKLKLISVQGYYAVYQVIYHKRQKALLEHQQKFYNIP